MRYDHFLNRLPKKNITFHKPKWFKHQFDYASLEKKMMNYWNPLPTYSHTYSSIYGLITSPRHTDWKHDIYTRSSKPPTFLTNIRKTNLDRRLPEYQQAAAEVGTEVEVRDDASTMHGKPLSDCVAIYIADVEKKSVWWGIIIKQIAKEVTDDLGKQEKIVCSFGLKPAKPKLCQCETQMLMRNGCRCGGV